MKLGADPIIHELAVEWAKSKLPREPKQFAVDYKNAYLQISESFAIFNEQHNDDDFLNRNGFGRG